MSHAAPQVDGPSAHPLPGLSHPWAPGRFLPQGLCTGQAHALLPGDMRLPPLLQTFAPPAYSHRGCPWAARCTCRLAPSPGAVVVHSTPPPSGQADCRLPAGRDGPGPGRLWERLLPWVASVVGTQLAELGLQFRGRSPFSLQAPQWSPEPEGAAVLEGYSPPVLEAALSGPSVSQLGAGQAWLSARPDRTPLTSHCWRSRAPPFSFPKPGPQTPKPAIFQRRNQPVLCLPGFP